VASIMAAWQHATRPGATLGQILQAGTQAYQEAGYGELWEQSDQGGLVGYRVREATAFPDSMAPVQGSQAVAWRCRLPLMGVEDTFLVTPEGLENLTEIPDWPSQSVTIAEKTYAVPGIGVRKGAETGDSE